MPALHELSAAELAASYEGGELSPVEVTKALLAHIDAWEPRLNAMYLIRRESALKQAREVQPDLVLLDIMVPQLNGWEVCRRLKHDADTKNIPVIMVTGRVEEGDKVLGFEMGADDYVTKPFSPRELLARVRAVVRRGRGDGAERKAHVRIGELEIDRHRFEVRLKGRVVELTPKEFELLAILAGSPGRVFGREELLAAVWPAVRRSLVTRRSVGAAAVATELTTGIFGNLGLGIATGAMTMILLVFGEITPKSYCAIHAEPISRRYARVILGMQFTLYPIVRALEGVTKGIFQVTGSDETPKPMSEEEVRAVIDVGVEEKALQKSEKEMMEDVLEFHDTKVRAIMTPRNKMVVLDARMLLWDALPLINKSGYSRIPIMEDTKDNIVGIVHMRDVLKSVETNTSYMMLKDIARKPLFVSMEMGINKLMKEFQGRHIHMAIVVDEHGSTEGLVTLEDILEELVGEIVDETDIETQQVKKVDKQTVITRGDVEIDDVNEALNINLPKDKDYSTLSGLLHDRLQRIPRKGDRLEIGNTRITVEETGKSQPLSVRIQKTTSAVESKQKQPDG